MTLQITSRKDYESIPAINISALLAGPTPAHVRAYLDNPPEQTDAMVLGTATHLRVFEQGEADKRIGIRPEEFDSYRTKAAKQWRDDLLAVNGIPLTPKEMEQVEGMTASLMARDEIREILTSPGKSEAALKAKCPETGLTLKGRIDRIGTYQNWPTLFDLKTCQDASAEEFLKHAYSMDYHTRAAWYLDLANLVATGERRFIIMAVEKSEPYACRLFEFDDNLLEIGRKKYKAALNRWANAEKEKKYESFPVGVEVLEAKPWMK